MKNLESEIKFLKTKLESLETHLEELKRYYFKDLFDEYL